MCGRGTEGETLTAGAAGQPLLDESLPWEAGQQERGGCILEQATWASACLSHLNSVLNSSTGSAVCQAQSEMKNRGPGLQNKEFQDDATTTEHETQSGPL